VGFLSSLLGGKAKHVGQSAQEKALIAHNQRQMALLNSVYNPIQDRAIAQAGTDYTSFLAGRSSADNALATRNGLNGAVRQLQTGAGANSGKFLANLSALNAQANTANGRSAVKASADANKIIDNSLNNVSNVGFGLGGTVQSGLGSLASNQFSRDSTIQAAQGQEKAARLGMIGSLIGAGAMTGYAAYNKTGMFAPKKAVDTTGVISRANSTLGGPSYSINPAPISPGSFNTSPFLYGGV